MSSSNASASSRSPADDLRSMAQDVKVAAGETVGAATQRAQQLGSDVRHAVQDRMEDLQSRASEYYEQGRAKVRELNESVENRIRAQPLAYLLLAGGIGFALGFLLTKRR